MAQIEEGHEVLFSEHSGLNVVAQCAAQSPAGSRRNSEVGLARPDASRASAVGISRSITRSPGYSLSMDSTASGSQTNDGPIVAPFHPVGDYAASGIIAERSRSAAEGNAALGQLGDLTASLEHVTPQLHPGWSSVNRRVGSSDPAIWRP